MYIVQKILKSLILIILGLGAVQLQADSLEEVSVNIWSLMKWSMIMFLVGIYFRIYDETRNFVFFTWPKFSNLLPPWLQSLRGKSPAPPVVQPRPVPVEILMFCYYPAPLPLSQAGAHTPELKHYINRHHKTMDDKYVHRQNDNIQNYQRNYINLYIDNFILNLNIYL